MYSKKPYIDIQVYTHVTNVAAQYPGVHKN